MALDFDGKYTPASNPADGNYPFGSAKNDSVPGDKTGSPLDKDWLNDFLGFHQKLLNFANITPSGNPDTILASDYFNSLQKIINVQSPYYVDSGAANALIVTGDPAYTVYTAGMKLRVKIAVTGTGAATINVDSLGVKNIKKRVSQALIGGELQAGDVVDFTYNGTNFLMTFINHGHTSINDGGLIVPGAVVQVVNTQDGEVSSGTTFIPHDDTIPQNTEGDEVMTRAITPTNATNILKIEVKVFASTTSSSRVACALFQDAIVPAIACSSDDMVNVVWGSSFTHFMTAGGTSEITFKVRIGGNSGTTTFNGEGGSRLFGGVLASRITITELQS